MKPLYDHIGLTYDTTRKADPEISRRLRNHLQVPNGTKILDIACGTGNYTVSLEDSSLQMTGCDVSIDMIMKAKEKSNTIEWNLANVNELPYENNSFKGGICTLAIHHFDDLFVPFQEMYRVIDKGKFVIFTSSPDQMKCYWLKEYFPKAIEDSASQMPSTQKVSSTLKKVGFSIVGHETFLVQPNLQDFFLYSGKYEPKMYLDEKVRSGISTFANLALKEEIEKGIEKLQNDIGSKNIDKVLEKYKSELGDYVFIIAEKK